MKAEKMKRLEARLTEQELQIMQKRMEQCGIRNKSAYIRKMVIDGYSIQMDLTDVKEVVRLLRINSNNLNQYAKKANETGSIYLCDINELKAQQEKLWVTLKAILARLSEIK